MKLGKVISPQFQMAFRSLEGQKLPLRAAFFVKGVAKQIKEEITKYDSARMDSLKHLGETKEDGTLDADESGNVKLSDENMKKFTEQLQSLLEVDVTVSPIKINDLGSEVKLTPAEALALEDIITE